MRPPPLQRAWSGSSFYPSELDFDPFFVTVPGTVSFNFAPAIVLKYSHPCGHGLLSAIGPHLPRASISHRQKVPIG